jgi:hypothetical protein
MEVEFTEALRHGGVLKLRDLNSGFTKPNTIALAYCQASLQLGHLAATFGEAVLRKLVRAFTQGLETDVVLKLALDTDFDRLQTGFEAA